MGTLKTIADKLSSDDINELNMPLVIVASIAASVGMGTALLDDYDVGTDLSQQVTTSLAQEIKTVSSLSQVDDIQKRRDILSTERQLDELKNGEWEELSDEDVAFMRAQKQFDVDEKIASTEFKQALTPVYQNLILNTDISESDYGNLRDKLENIANANNVQISFSSQARSLKECQLSVVGADAQMPASLSDNFKNVQSCMEDRVSGEDAFLTSVATLLGTFMFLGGFGCAALGTGLSALDRSLDERKARIKKKKVAPN